MTCTFTPDSCFNTGAIVCKAARTLVETRFAAEVGVNKVNDK